MAGFIALPKLPSAKETAAVTMNQVFRVHGFPKDTVSDRGPQLVSRFWREFCRLTGTMASLTLGYHPEATGQTERLNQQMETGLWCLVSQNPSTWSKHLVWVNMLIILCLLLLLVCLLFTVFGYQPPVFPANELEVTVPTDHVMARCCHRIWAAARQILIRQGDRVKKARPQEATGSQRSTWSECGYQQKTCIFVCPQRSWRQGLWVHSPSPESSVLQQFDYVCPGPSAYTQPST